MATEDAAQAIEAATNSVYACCISADAETLGEILCDDVAYFHSSSLRDSKSSLLEKVGSGAFSGMESIEFLRDEIRVLGEAAVVKGTSIMTGMVGTYRLDHQTSNVLDVWRLRDGRWQLQAHHVTREPEPKTD
jgi:ketosteroid isomerase-like protein